MKPPSPTSSPDTPGNWAADAAASVADRLDLAQRTREAAETHAQQLIAAVEASGLVFFQRLFAELHSAAAAFNARLGRPVVDVSQWPSGQILMNALLTPRALHHINVMPLLTTEPHGPAPGATVTVTQHSCANQTPYDFDLDDGDRLCLRAAGALLGPEAFGRHLTADWLRTLPLGGR